MSVAIVILIGILSFYAIKRRFDYLELQERVKDGENVQVIPEPTRLLPPTSKQSKRYIEHGRYIADSDVGGFGGSGGYSRLVACTPRIAFEERVSYEENLLRIVRSPVISLKMGDVEMMRLRCSGKVKYYTNSIESNKLSHIRLVDENENSICVLEFIDNKHSTNPALNMKTPEICTDWGW